jgi:malate permease and related proteins
MASTLILFLLLLIAGYVARRFARFPDSAADVLNRFVVDVCVPAAILRLVPGLHLRAELSLLAIVPWLAAGVAYVFSRVLAQPLALDRGARTTLFLCVGLGNTSFLGFPLCAALLGEASVPLAAVYDQLGSFMLLSTVGVVVIAQATGEETPDVSSTVRRIVTFPPFVALSLALLPLPHPAWLDDALAKIGAALVPVAMFAVGLRTRVTPPNNARALAVGLGLKLVIMPLLALGFATLVGASRAVLSVAVLETAMPPMITASALAMAAGLAPDLAAAFVGWGIVLGLFTVPAWASLLRQLY